jgi:hypothetical protein
MVCNLFVSNITNSSYKIFYIQKNARELELILFLSNEKIASIFFIKKRMPI